MSKNYKKSFSWHFPAYGWVRHLICNNVIHLMHRDFILTFWTCLNFYDDMMKIYLILRSILESLHKSLEPQASTNQYDWQPIKKFKKYICIIQLKLNELCIYSNICLKEFLPSIQPNSCSWSPTKQTAMTDM